MVYRSCPKQLSHLARLRSFSSSGNHHYVLFFQSNLLFNCNYMHLYFLHIYLTLTENLIWCCVTHGCQIKACKWQLELRLFNSASVYDIHAGQTRCNTVFKKNRVPLRKAVISPRPQGLWLPCKGERGGRVVSAWRLKEVIKFRLGSGEDASSCLAENAICKERHLQTRHGVSSRRGLCAEQGKSVSRVVRKPKGCFRKCERSAQP